MQDPSINWNIKKRILMTALANGYFANIEDWTLKTNVTLHVWQVRQRLESGVYKGNFDLTVFMGSHKLNCYFDQRTNLYYLSKYNLDDPELLFSLFKELISILKISSDVFLKQVQVGDWLIVDDKILRSNKNGFRIAEAFETNPIMLNDCYLVVNEEKTSLYDKYDYNLLNIETGLLDYTGPINLEFDFECYGLSFIDLCKIGAFNQNFNSLYHSKEETLSIIKNLKVSKPKISEITKKRLNLVDWETRGEEKIEYKMEVEDRTNIMKFFMEIDTSELKLEDIQSKDPLEDMLSFLIDTDVILSMKTTQKILQTRKIYNIVRGLKYELICHHFLSEMRINKFIISSVSKLLQSKDEKKYILYSLINYYDRIYQYEGYQSPTGLILNINKDFINKFDLTLNEEYIEFD
jgi:hypothetical protein